VGPQAHPYNPFQQTISLGGGGGGPPPMTPTPFGPLYLRKHHSPMESPPGAHPPGNPSMLNHRLTHPWSPHLPYFPALPHHSPLNFNRSPFLNPAAAASYLPGAPSFQNLLAHLNVAAAAQQMNQQLPPGHPLASLNAAELLLQHSMAAQGPSGSSSQQGGLHSPVGGSTASPHFSPDDSGHSRSGGRKSLSPLTREHDESSDSDFRVISPHSDDSNRRNSSINTLRVKAKEHAEALRALHNNSTDVVTTN